MLTYVDFVNLFLTLFNSDYLCSFNHLSVIGTPYMTDNMVSLSLWAVNSQSDSYFLFHNIAEVCRTTNITDYTLFAIDCSEFPDSPSVPETAIRFRFRFLPQEVSVYNSRRTLLSASMDIGTLNPLS